MLFPYLLYRFATEFVPPTFAPPVAVAALTVGLIDLDVRAAAPPARASSGPPGSSPTSSSSSSTGRCSRSSSRLRLWRAGRAQPSVAANRMRMLGFAAAALTLAILGTAFASNHATVGALLVQVLAFVAIARFRARRRAAADRPRLLAHARAAAAPGGDPRPGDARDHAGGDRRTASPLRPPRSSARAVLAVYGDDGTVARDMRLPPTRTAGSGSSSPARRSSPGRRRTRRSSATTSCARSRPSPRSPGSRSTACGCSSRSTSRASRSSARTR